MDGAGLSGSGRPRELGRSVEPAGNETNDITWMPDETWQATRPMPTPSDMNDDDLHAEIDWLARQIERRIERNEAFLESTADFDPTHPAIERIKETIFG